MKVKRKNQTIKVIIQGDSYCSDLQGKTALKMTNHGNGWTLKFPAFREQYDTTILELGYDQMALIALAVTRLDWNEK